MPAVMYGGAESYGGGGYGGAESHPPPRQAAAPSSSHGGGASSGGSGAVTIPGGGGGERNITRTVAGQTWKDETLLQWPEDDFRIFVGDLGNEANDDSLSAAFQRYPSFQMARVIRDRQSKKSKGYGFVSFKDPWDMTKALREMHGKYVGNRPIKVRKSTAQERQASDGKASLQFTAALGVADKSMKRQLERGGAVHTKPTWKQSKKQKNLPW